MIAVVGGGLIGSAIAFTLSQAGAEVVVLDAGLAGAAWQAGAGMLTPTGERLAGTPLQRSAGESLRLWPDFARHLAEATGQAVPFRLGVEHVSYSRALHRPPSAAHPQPSEATTHPPSVVRAALHGLEVRRTEVLGLEPLRSGVRLHTASGDLYADRAVLAAGAWSGRFGLPVFPVRGQALLLGGQMTLPARYTDKGHTPETRGFPLYGLPRPDGHYVGATVRPHRWDTAPLPSDGRWLRQAAQQLWPEAEAGALRPERTLVGLRPATANGLPLVGPLSGWDGRVLAATGHGRHGALLAPLTARQVAEALL